MRVGCLPLPHYYLHRMDAQTLADNIRYIAHEMCNEPLGVVEGLAICPRAFAADLGCSVDDLAARLTFIA